jgi:sRNA-binding carbon storage regulator CsrA
MLTFKRRIGETIRLTTEAGERIVIVVERVTNCRVSTSIEAPATVRVERGELPHEPIKPAKQLTPSSEGNARLRRQARALEGFVRRGKAPSAA